MMRALAFLFALLITAPPAHGSGTAEAVSHVVIPVSDLGRAASFYTSALSFAAGDRTEARGIVLRLGRESIELVHQGGRPIPTDSRSNDRWFQHLAIVVSDIERAYALVRWAGARPISTAPQQCLEPAGGRHPRGVFP